MPDPQLLRVFVIEDFPVIREGLVRTLNAQAGLTVIGEAATYTAAGQMLEAGLPDVLTLDMLMSDGSDGLAFIEEMRARHPRLPMLVLSLHEESIYAERALRAGANGYLMNNQPTSELIQALRTVAEGEIYLSRKLSSQFLRRLLQPGSIHVSTGVGITSLTDRELHVFRLIGTGLSPRKIAEHMGLSVSTIEAHRDNIRTKLDVHTFAQVIQQAIEWVNTRNRP